MADELIIVKKASVTALADSIRNKTNTEDSLTFKEMSELIENMPEAEQSIITYDGSTKTLTISTTK